MFFFFIKIYYVCSSLSYIFFIMLDFLSFGEYYYFLNHFGYHYLNISVCLYLIYRRSNSSIETISNYLLFSSYLLYNCFSIVPFIFLSPSMYVCTIQWISIYLCTYNHLSLWTPLDDEI